MDKKLGELKMTNNVEQKILLAFSQLLVSYGYQGTTTKKIAHTAGVNESTVFRHFKDKRHILLKLVTNYSNDIQTVSNKYKLVGNLEQDLMNFAIIYQNFVNQHLAIFLTSIREAQSLPELDQIFKDLLTMIKEIMMNKMQQMQQTGEISPQIDIKIEIENLILLNIGQGIMQHSFSSTVFKIPPRIFIQDNIRAYAQHLKP